MGSKSLTKATALNSAERFSIKGVGLRFAHPTYQVGLSALLDHIRSAGRPGEGSEGGYLGGRDRRPLGVANGSTDGLVQADPSGRVRDGWRRKVLKIY